jgi:hypothetical protein
MLASDYLAICNSSFSRIAAILAPPATPVPNEVRPITSTLRRTECIRPGEEPWVALSNFVYATEKLNFLGELSSALSA